MTVFERCVEAVERAAESDATFSPAGVTRAVLTALSEHTGSPRTVDEVMRVLGEAG